MMADDDVKDSEGIMTIVLSNVLASIPMMRAGIAQSHGHRLKKSKPVVKNLRDRSEQRLAAQANKSCSVSDAPPNNNELLNSCQQQNH